MTHRIRILAPTALTAVALAVAGCGGGDEGPDGLSSDHGPVRTATTRVEVIRQASDGRFDPSAIYAREAPGVVTVISLFEGDRDARAPTGGEGLGSGFVIDGDGRIATNAHVVTNGEGNAVRRAETIYVQFSDGNQVPARIVGTDLNSDVALIEVDPADLTLRPLPLGSSRGLTVGVPVAAIGSPFGEPQSLSVGVISGVNRTIDSLNSGGPANDGRFAIGGAIQTDAAINHGNSGGPLVDAAGRVIGINAQIQSTGGGGEGVGFAIPVDTVRRSLDQLAASGRVDYAWIGVSTVPVFPQLARRLGLPSTTGALVQAVTADGPAAVAGLDAGSADDEVEFMAQRYATGGDLITALDGEPITRDRDLAAAIADDRPGDVVTLEVWRGGEQRTVQVTLGTRPG
ncbi:trypsin-like peptidase domain-containing protein [Conexibacter sp. JD483]|uniref:S1C family serine protease n=1 Tax=unclassified Conexibacter TaxID=2627773 RepID=UPI0027245123|nr:MULTISPECIES: trypsin-like peptidase domain-containing protein [unclassified Conexibacter]MDO8184399.1 trypsin-like peptidase domain-containing protein [Conexibacter sp. CPCC 205706]MDO8197705.1 trypsin-like peptidase domain-containing protein [Conexibacter sp. CPCC 205762]MDR9368368.1 trypsin-like peptidase domain-containing protein [Conexibacter sp. JD483]